MEETEIIKFWNNICKPIESMNNHKLSLGIWLFVKKYDIKDLKFSKEGFKSIYRNPQVACRIECNEQTGCGKFFGKLT